MVLALDTSTVVAAAAVTNDDTILAELTWSVARSHSERILEAVDTVLRLSGVSRNELDRIAVTTGPGSFTGLRIGMSLARGLAEGLRIPAVGVSTLQLLAEQVSHHVGIIAPLLCAQRGEYYTAMFLSDGMRLNRQTADSVLAPADIGSTLAAVAEPVLLTGEGALLVPISGEYIRVAHPWLRLPRAGVLGTLARTQPVVDPVRLLPNYVRQSSAKPRQGGV